MAVNLAMLELDERTRSLQDEREKLYPDDAPRRTWGGDDLTIDHIPIGPRRDLSDDILRATGSGAGIREPIVFGLDAGQLVLIGIVGFAIWSSLK